MKPIKATRVWDQEGEPRVLSECEQKLENAQIVVDYMGQCVAAMLDNVEHHDLVIAHGENALKYGMAIFPGGWERMQGNDGTF